MSDSSGRRDIDVVLHGLLVISVAGGDVFVFLFLIPALFDMHRTELDLASLALAIGAFAFSYLAFRYIWRSAHVCIGGDD